MGLFKIQQHLELKTWTTRNLVICLHYTQRRLYQADGWVHCYLRRKLVSTYWQIAQKIVILLEELGLQYKTIHLDFDKLEQKGPEYTKYNPNGRKSSHHWLTEYCVQIEWNILGIPTLIDHNKDDFVIWESNTILKYLVENYDTEKRFHFPAGTKEATLLDQWLFFQASGQLCHECLESA